MGEPGNDTTHPGDLPPDGPLLAIDWGEKRIGLALSDAAQRLAHPLATLRRRAGRRFPLARLREHLDRAHPVGVLVGLPLDERGHEGDAAARAREAGRMVAEKTGLPVTFRDERMTTARVLRAARAHGRRAAGLSEKVDQLAATVLLQGFLDSRR